MANAEKTTKTTNVPEKTANEIWLEHKYAHLFKNPATLGLIEKLSLWSDLSMVAQEITKDTSVPEAYKLLVECLKIMRDKAAVNIDVFDAESVNISYADAWEIVPLYRAALGE
ncbi:hypothetical protein [Mobiluncus curtisii]|uniref:hypothetical protein n=1 Tax=Mobiluncus curtisii TaxID=2051 RepID=UPI00242F2755|nr:hypothetical protein [Mobiluncus curtisii]